jgi:uncharacterized RDD family membrane protein YckC
MEDMSSTYAYDAAPGGVSAIQVAGFWRRFVAYILDSILVSVVGGVIGNLIAAVVHASGTTVVAPLTTLVFGLVYFGILWSRDGQSFGYRLLGIRLIRGSGEPISFGFGMLRFLLIYLSILLLLVPAIISAFMVGLGSRKRALHDVMMNTQVVRA